MKTGKNEHGAKVCRAHFSVARSLKRCYDEKRKSFESEESEVKRLTATALILAACLCFSGCVNIYTDGGKGKEKGETPAPASTAEPTADTSKIDTGSAKAYEDYGTLRAASGGENIPRTQDYQISASSTKAPMAGISYGAENLKDNSLDTAWVEGVSGSGVGERLLITPAHSMEMKGFLIRNGYCKNDKAFAENGRVRLLKVHLYDGSPLCTLQLENDRSAQYFALPEVVTVYGGDTLSFTIEDTYSGPEDGEYDTALSEIALLGF